MENAHYCIIGAGSAGLSAGYTLKQMGMERITILEASSVVGGRARKMDPPIADFPIDLGGEWISGDPSRIFDSMTGIPGTADNIETILHDINPYGEWTGREMEYNNQMPWGYKFVNYTWYDFLNDYLAPDIRENIIFDSPVRTINYENANIVIVETTDDSVYECDRVIVTVSLQVLKDGDITFRPQLPRTKRWALEQAVMPSAIKVFMKFTETFYPEGFSLSDYMDYETYAYGGDQTYYDVTYGQDTDENILGLFAYYGPTEDYYKHRGANDMQEYILNELDDIFDGKASETFVEMVIQDWEEEQYIRGAYSSYNSWLTFASAINQLGEPIDDRIFLAGEAVPTNAFTNGFVHTAAFSGQEAAERAAVERSSDGILDGGWFGNP